MIIEDFIEYEVLGIVQLQVNNLIGMIFVCVLCVFLCQDFDIIFVGEICDQEIVKIVVEVVFIGYMVFVILYINDVLGVVICFEEMGIENFNILVVVMGVFVQWLVCWVCSECKQFINVDFEVFWWFGISECDICGVNLMCGIGCFCCGGIGYKGCMGIYELMVMDDLLCCIIGVGWFVVEICDVVLGESGLWSLCQDGIEKVL